MTTSRAKGKAASVFGRAVDLHGRLGSRLALAAVPTFALMAWISAVSSPGMIMCSATSAFLPISDMAVMYLLMSVFHVSPWLKLFSARSPDLDTPITQTEGD